MFVEFHTAARLNAGKDELRDKLNIRVDGGDYLSVSLNNDWLCFSYFRLVGNK